MVEILKKFKPYIAVCLLVQSVSLVLLFFMLCRKKQGLANTFLALAALSGAVGGALFWQEYGEVLGLKASEDDGKTLDFSDVELDIDESAINAELGRDDGDSADDDGSDEADVPSEESSEDDFKGI